MTQDIMRKLSRLNNIPYLNQGGCGFVALALGNYIKENNPYMDCCLVLCYSSGYDKDEIQSNRRAFESKDSEFSCCSHVLIANDGFFLDSEGSRNEDDLRQRYKVLDFVPFDAEVLQKSLSEKHYWNPDFCRKDIQEIFEVFGFPEEKLIDKLKKEIDVYRIQEQIKTAG